ncbi:uncharacterized protein N7511_005248 [Penicillium nucicola]|uniref:uncharacterized protein n=1 Tax=Penicillium nucicola TaxID=1850975 RepID=UPI002544D9CD|nr:uncharacterized protein N7511_005248 [Penicillium nucicola]KAJ5761866.1 hypothetical protein N7511_005248 [Penicillium nucicola]
MDPLHKSPSFASSRATSATFPLSKSSTRRTQLSDQQSTPEELSAVNTRESRTGRHSRRPSRYGLDDRGISPKGATSHASSSSRRTRLSSPSRQPVEFVGYDGSRSQPHKHSKSRELRLPRHMSHLASSATARGLLPTWSGGRDKDRDGDDGLLRPITRETTRSRWGSDSTGPDGSRRGSLFDLPEQERLGPIRRQEIQSPEDLERVRKRRKQGEEYLRSALASIGTLATDVTRRLDYTYYNLLEKITALNSTISSFQELSDSASTLLGNFERETAGLDQDIRKQISDLKGFEPQIEKADALHARMKTGRQRVEELDKRLETVRHEIDSWEQRETEWQTRTSRRLRIFWGIATSALLVLVLALVFQNWPPFQSPDALLSHLTALNQSSVPLQSDTWDSFLGLDGTGKGSAAGASPYPSSLADRRKSLAKAGPTTSTEVRTGPDTLPTEHDPLKVLDEI